MHRTRRSLCWLGLVTLVWGSAPARAGGRTAGPRLRTGHTRTPVTMVLVIDRSGSMAGEKIRMTRVACQHVIRRLKPADRAGVVAFDTTPRQMLHVRPVGTGRAAVAAIGRIQPHGGTAYLAALVMANRMLTRATPRRGERRHILFLSDGQAPRAGVLDAIRRLRKRGITVSTVAISPHADRAFLARMAQVGGGRTHYVPHVSTLTRMLRRELASLGR